MIRFGKNERVRIEKMETLSDNWYVLRKVSYSWRRADGTWQSQEREAYDRGDGVVALIVRRKRGTVLLTRQFRVPTYLNGHDGMLIEAAAGLIEDLDPETTMIKEIEEETGYRTVRITKILESFMSPGAVTERLHFYIAEIDENGPATKGGGLEDEGEDIEVIEFPLDEALAMIRSGAIMDAKTIMLLQHLALNRTEYLDE